MWFLVSVLKGRPVNWFLRVYNVCNAGNIDGCLWRLSSAFIEIPYFSKKAKSKTNWNCILISVSLKFSLDRKLCSACPIIMFKVIKQKKNTKTEKWKSKWILIRTQNTQTRFSTESKKKVLDANVLSILL